MKKILKDFLAIAIALWVTAEIVKGVKIEGNWLTFLTVAFSLYVLLFLVKPIAKIVFLPINLLTLNLFNLVLNAVLLFTLTKILPQFSVLPFYFSGYTYQGFVIPTTQVDIPYVFIVASFFVTGISWILRWFFN